MKGSWEMAPTRPASRSPGTALEVTLGHEVRAAALLLRAGPSRRGLGPGAASCARRECVFLGEGPWRMSSPQKSGPRPRNGSEPPVRPARARRDPGGAGATNREPEGAG